MHVSKLLINGVDTSGQGQIQETLSPWDQQPFAQIEGASSDQVLGAISMSNEAYFSWRETTIHERIKTFKNAISSLRNDSERLAELLHKEIGKFPEEAKSEIDRSIDFLELMISAIKHLKGEIFYGDIDSRYIKNSKKGFYERVPLGVIVAVSPFNYPINLSISKIAPALIAGNTVVFKPPTQGAITSLEFYKHFNNAGLPPNVLNVVTGVSGEIGDTLMTSDLVKLIAFTGSTAVGNHIRQISKGIPLLLELGGKDVGIVTENANLERTLDQVLRGAFQYSGQRCTAQKLLLVNKQIEQEFKNILLPRTSEVRLNPLIDEKAANYAMELFHDAREKGAQVEIEPRQERNMMTPGIVSNVNSNMRIFHEEQFGPILPIVSYESDKEAISLANSLRYGLQASVYTKDIDQAFMFSDKLEVGTVQINAKPDRRPDNFPFGGTKDSGQFMQSAIESLNLMTRGKLTILNR